MSSSDLELYQQLDAQLISLADEFANLVRAGGAGALDDPGPDAAGGGGGGGAGGRGGGGRRQVPGELLEALTEKLLAAGHQCIHTVSQLKRGAMLSDFSSLITSVRVTRTALEHQVHSASAELAAMRQDVQLLLNDLEGHYYGSAHRGPAPPPPPSELAQLCTQVLQRESGWPWAAPVVPAAAAVVGLGPGEVGGAAVAQQQQQQQHRQGQH